MPVGIVVSAVSGTPIERWIPLDAMKADPVVSQLMEKFNDPVYAARFNEEVDYYRLHSDEGYEPPEEYARNYFLKEAGNLFPKDLVPYGIRGIIWYQGEANARLRTNARDYQMYLPLLISSWRAKWKEPSLPFYYVQIPSIRRDKNESFDRAYEIVRDGQLKSLDMVGNAGMAVCIDINNGLHPAANYDVISGRLALLALKDTYALRTECASGPLFSGAEVQGQTMICHFTEIGSGLMVEGESLNHFELAGEDRIFLPATASILEDTVVVSSQLVANPKFVRYACEANPEDISLFNIEGIPASPFTSEDGMR